MVQKHTLGRGVAVLAALALVAGALIVSPVGAAAPVTKKKVKKIATKVFNQKIKTAKAADADKIDGIDSASLQQKCQDGSILAYAFINGDGGDGGTGGTPSTTGFSTSGVGPSFNCKGGPIEVWHIPDGFYQVRIPGLTTTNPVLGVYIFQSADSHNDGIVNIDTHSSDDYIEVDTFEASGGVADDADFYLIALR